MPVELEQNKGRECRKVAGAEWLFGWDHSKDLTVSLDDFHILSKPSGFLSMKDNDCRWLLSLLNELT
jgi:hypothetical protein